MADRLIAPVGIAPIAVARVEIKKLVAVAVARTAMRLPAVTRLPWKHAETPHRLVANRSQCPPAPQLRIAPERIDHAKIARATTAPVGIARAAKRPRLHGIAVRERTLLRRRNPLPPVKIDLVDVANEASDRLGMIARLAKNGLSNRRRSLKVTRVVSPTTSLIVWHRKKPLAQPVRVVAGMMIAAVIEFHLPVSRWTISPLVMTTPSAQRTKRKVLATPIVQNVRVVGAEDADGVQLAIVRPMRRLPLPRKPSSTTNRWPMTMMGSDPAWLLLGAVRNAVQLLTAPLRIADARTEVLTIAATVRHEPKKKRRAAPSNALAGIATKAQPGPLVRSEGLAMMRTDPPTVPPVGNPPQEMTLGAMNHVGSPLAGAATRKPRPRVQTVELVTTARPGMTVPLATIAPYVGTLPIVAATRPTRSRHGQLHHAPNAVTGTTVPLVATRPTATATVMPTYLDLPAPTLLARDKAVAMIGRRDQIEMIARPAGTATTDRPAETTPRVRIVDRESLHAALSRASRPLRAATGMMRTPTTTSKNRLVLSPRRSMLQHGNMPSRC